MRWQEFILSLLLESLVFPSQDNSIPNEGTGRGENSSLTLLFFNISLLVFLFFLSIEFSFSKIVYFYHDKISCVFCVRCKLLSLFICYLSVFRAYTFNYSQYWRIYISCWASSPSTFASHTLEKKEYIITILHKKRRQRSSPFVQLLLTSNT